MFKLALFDLDDTCFDHGVEKDCYRAVIDYCKTKNINVTMNDIISSKEKAKNKTPNTINRLLYFKKLFPSDLNLSLECYKVYWNKFYSSIEPFEGLIEVLECFKKYGIKMRICTNFTLEHQIEKCKSLKILSYFEDICTSEESCISKPHERIFKDSIEPYKYDEVCMFGDRNDTDIKGCSYLGIKSFFIGKHNKPLYSEGVFYFKNWIEVRDFFKVYFESLYTLIECCKRVGERFDYTQAGGGNISIKFTYKKVDFIIIKSSGVALSEVTLFNGHTLLTKSGICWGKKESIETCLHTTCTSKIVVHCHPISLVASMCNPEFKTNYPLIPYKAPGKELSNAILPYKDEPIILLSNHGIIYQTNDICLDKLNEVCGYFKEYDLCNTISSKLGGITILSQLSNRFDALFKKNTDICKFIITPDVAVFCGEIIKDDISQAKNTSNIFYINSFIYIHSPSLKMCKQIEEVFQFQLMCLEKFFIRYTTPLTLSNVEANKLQNREDEKYRKQN
jgi:HAD superfamily hydrolase (TIGR01549 family)